jgi:hypothetical protein
LFNFFSTRKGMVHWSYLGFFARFTVNFLMAFFIMRLIYLYHSEDEVKKPHTTTIKFKPVKSAPKSTTRIIETRSLGTKHSNQSLSDHRYEYQQFFPLFSSLNIFLFLFSFQSRINGTIKTSKRRNNPTFERTYSEWENVVRPVDITWEQFVNLPIEIPRSRQAIPFNALNNLQSCKNSEINTEGNFYRNNNNNNNTNLKKGCSDVSDL